MHTRSVDLFVHLEKDGNAPFERSLLPRARTLADDKSGAISDAQRATSNLRPKVWKRSRACVKRAIASLYSVRMR